MSEINVQLNNGPAVSILESATVAEALKKLDRDLAKQAIAAKVNGREVDLTADLSQVRGNNIEELAQQTEGRPIT
ncbi:MAG TPA: TGS domain-containing protein, partial [Verrucomicrobiae bacterium]